MLGIGPTSDTRAIRRAYAARLKTIDVDCDPKAFIELREAFEAAQREAEWRGRATTEEVADWDAEEAEDEGESDEDEGVALAAGDLPDPSEASTGPDPRLEPEAEESQHEETRTGPWSPLTPEQIEEHANRLAHLLHEVSNPESPWSRTDQSRLMFEHWNAVVSDPRMKQVGFYADAETWLGNLLAQTIPASDPLLPLAVEQFGWERTAGTIDQTPAAGRILQRLHMLDFWRAVQGPRHPLHAAWRELITPAGEDSRRGWMVSGAKVRQLLATVRRDYPELESEFDWYRVALWEPGSAGGPVGGVGADFIVRMALIGLFVLMSLARSCSPETHDPALPLPVALESPALEFLSPLSNQDDDLRYALDQVDGDRLSWAIVQVDNPDLAKVLVSNWTAARDARKPRYQFAADVKTLLDVRFRNGLAIAPYALIARYQSLERDKARALRGRSAEDCDAFFADRTYSRDPLSALIQLRQHEVFAQVLLETDGREPAKGNGSFMVPGGVLDSITDKTGLRDQRLRDALNGRGTPEDRCAARIALIDAALALPPAKGLKLLREM
ncbi:hypothetical protein [Sphingomonas sp.]|uniref:hypothetical protein n=1 Tax=Sphingomonas sp. TaxID=28214 RepID=UPI0026005275|nr:hypothetical protein [Sphingomonas sp.]